MPSVTSSTVEDERWSSTASPGPRHAFSSDVQRELNRHTLCHNTVMVDTRDQRPNPELLTLERADLTPGRQTVVLGDPSGVLYEGVTQRRALTLTDEGVTDVYEVRSDEQHTYDYLLHYPPEAVVDLGLPLSDAELGWEPAASWLRNVRASRTNEPVMAAIRLGEVTWTSRWKRSRAQSLDRRLPVIGRPRVAAQHYPRDPTARLDNGLPREPSRQVDSMGQVGPAVFGAQHSVREVRYATGRAVAPGGKLDSMIKLDVALFFADNPDAMDSAASLGTWPATAKRSWRSSSRVVPRSAARADGWRLPPDPRPRHSRGLGTLPGSV